MPRYKVVLNQVEKLEMEITGITQHKIYMFGLVPPTSTTTTTYGPSTTTTTYGPTTTTTTYGPTTTTTTYGLTTSTTTYGPTTSTTTYGPTTTTTTYGPTTTTTTIALPLDFITEYSCMPNSITICGNNVSGGSGTGYQSGSWVFNSESAALANTNWINSQSTCYGVGTINGTWWIVFRDSANNIKAKSVTTNC